MENKTKLKIGTPIVIISNSHLLYKDYYYLGNGVIGTMNLPYNPKELFFIPTFNVFKEDWIKYVVPCGEMEKYKSLYNDDFLKSKIVDVDNLNNCLYSKENFEWWNDKQKNEIKSYY